MPRSAIDADLVELAGGPEPLAQRAMAKNAEGQWLEAIHLCEVALGAEPTNASALTASIQAHQGLLDQSENFWESAWLRREIERLRQARGDND